MIYQCGMSPRLFAVLLGAAVFGLSAPARAANNNAPVPVMAVPATVETVGFDIHDDGDKRMLAVTLTPSILRIDIPSDGYSIIYDPRTEHYFGLENRNYTYWEFTWPAVRSAVETTPRYEMRMHDFVASSADGDTANSSPSDLPQTDTTPPSTQLDTNATSAPASTDDSGYTWQATASKKRIAGFDCILWKGESLSGGSVQAWCYPGAIPSVNGALDQLRAVNEPVALVPVRNLVPDTVFMVDQALRKGGVTPVLITWGDEGNNNLFALTGIKRHEGKLSLFSVPKLYVKTTLITMDGIGGQKATDPRPPETPQPILPDDSGSGGSARPTLGQ